MSVLLIRANRNEVDAEALAAFGIDCIIDPFMTITPRENDTGVARMRAALEDGEPSWLIATSTNALPMFDAALAPNTSLAFIVHAQPSLSFAAIGERTEQQLRALGATEVVRAPISESASLADVLATSGPGRAVIPASSIAMDTLTTTLARAGWEVISEVVYDTDTVPEPPASVEALARGDIDLVVFRSPSAVRAFVTHAGVPPIAVVCAGRTTARQAEALGFPVAAVAASPEPAAVAAAIAAVQLGAPE